mgnify:CR=1 FL=1
MLYTIERKINYNTEKAEKQSLIKAIIATIKMFMSENGHTYVEPDNDIETLDYVFSVGGDGTMMHAISKYISYSPVYIGINAGNVGFLTPYEISAVFDGSIFENIFSPQNRVEDRSLIQYEINNETFTAVNEIAINPPEINQMIDFSMEVDHSFTGTFRKAGRYSANTLLLSTAMGSTAYNKNAGGAIVEPNMSAMQFTLIAPTLLGSRPIIFNEQSRIKIIANNRLDIWNDGNKSSQINIGDTFIVTIHKNKAKIMLPDAWNYFNFLSKKLHWNNGQDIK